MKAHEIMTRDLITVKPDTPVREIAALMAEKHISGVPVVADDGQVIGVVSQGDLLHREEIGTERRPKSWLRVFADPDQMAREYVRTHGLRAHDIMSRHVVSVSADADLQHVADTMDKHRFKRVPVVDKGKLVGLITRGDIVRTLNKMQASAKAMSLDNTALEKALLQKMRNQPWLDGTYINLTVKDGAIELWGFIKSEDQRNALKVLIEETAGSRKVDDHLKVGHAYTTLY